MVQDITPLVIDAFDLREVLRRARVSIRRRSVAPRNEATPLLIAPEFLGGTTFVDVVVRCSCYRHCLDVREVGFELI